MNPHNLGSGLRSAIGLDPVAVYGFQISHRSAAQRPPEIALMAAVLEDAIHCIHKNMHAKRGRARREFLDAYRWIFDAEQSWPFAFENVCDILGLSAGAVRSTVGGLLIGATGSAGEEAADDEAAA